ncbi:hypothetical protein T484DRAFT_1760365, partial [Baffinella frigidus]
GLNKENQAIWKNFLHQGTLDQQSLEHRILTYPEHAVEAGSTSAPPASPPLRSHAHPFREAPSPSTSSATARSATSSPAHRSAMVAGASPPHGGSMLPSAGTARSANSSPASRRSPMSPSAAAGRHGGRAPEGLSDVDLDAVFDQAVAAHSSSPWIERASQGGGGVVGGWSPAREAGPSPARHGGGGGSSLNARAGEGSPARDAPADPAWSTRSSPAREGASPARDAAWSARSSPSHNAYPPPNNTPGASPQKLLGGGRGEEALAPLRASPQSGGAQALRGSADASSHMHLAGGGGAAGGLPLRSSPHSPIRPCPQRDVSPHQEVLGGEGEGATTPRRASLQPGGAVSPHGSSNSSPSPMKAFSEIQGGSLEERVARFLEENGLSPSKNRTGSGNLLDS